MDNDLLRFRLSLSLARSDQIIPTPKIITCQTVNRLATKIATTRLTRTQQVEQKWIIL